MNHFIAVYLVLKSHTLNFRFSCISKHTSVAYRLGGLIVGCNISVNLIIIGSVHYGVFLHRTAVEVAATFLSKLCF
jgi:hypothetical protein